jgi:hypothetical protein
MEINIPLDILEIIFQYCDLGKCSKNRYLNDIGVYRVNELLTHKYIDINGEERFNLVEPVIKHLNIIVEIKIKEQPYYEYTYQCVSCYHEQPAKRGYSYDVINFTNSMLDCNESVEYVCRKCKCWSRHGTDRKYIISHKTIKGVNKRYSISYKNDFNNFLSILRI